MNTADKITEMLRLQDETNQRLNPDWRNAGYDFLLAARMEAAEAIDHIGYKWWATKEPDWDQARMECVDIWHFLLSDMGKYSDKELRLMVDLAVERFDDPEKSSAYVLSHFEDLMRSHSVTEFLWYFADCCADVDLSFDHLYKLYIGKAALNRFRWDNGYGSTYQKIWDGREDNEHLTEILHSTRIEEFSLNQIIEKLSARYSQLTH